MGSIILLVMIRGAIGNGYKGIQSVLELKLILGSSTMTLVQGLSPVALGQDSTVQSKGDLLQLVEA